MRKANNEKSSVQLGTILIRVAAVLFWLLMVSVYLMSGLFARYVSKGQGGDSARVAGFDVAAALEPETVTVEYGVTPENEGTYTITVSNKSEVAVTYNIKVLVADPANIQVALDAQKASTSDTGEWLFQNAGYLSPSEKGEHELVFSLKDWAEFTKNVTGVKSKTSTINFQVCVEVVQVD